MEGGAGEICGRLLALVPEWFGLPEANQRHRAIAETHPNVVAHAGDDPVGLLTLIRHSPHAAEIHLMVVHRAWHRRGIGRRLLAAVEERLRVEGVAFLQVKTLSASCADEGYARTRRFYDAMGFVVLEEMPDLWGPSNPATILIKAIADHTSIAGS
jgi:GNAT superfamily N-acetyltransferase